MTTEPRMHVSQIAGTALTVTRAPSTKAKPVNTAEWAKWSEFELWGEDSTRHQLEAMLAGVARFVSDLKAQRKPHWLSLLGSSGAGKSFLAKRVWRWYARSGLNGAVVEQGPVDRIIYGGEFCYWPHVAADLLGNTGYERLADLARDRLVVFDEIGAERDRNGHVRDNLVRTLRARLGRWTIITSNLSLEQVADDIDTRLASAMVRDGSEVVEVNMPDYWLQRKGARP